MARGGERKGSGRPKNSGKFGVKTKPIRVPACLVSDIQDFIKVKLKEGLTK